MAEKYRVEQIPVDADTLGGKSAEAYQQELDFLHEQVGNKRQYSIINEAKDTLIHLADTVKGDMIISDCAINILPYNRDTIKTLNTEGTWDGYTYTWNGITYTLNEDGSVIVNGTATTSSFLIVFSNDTDFFNKYKGKTLTMCKNLSVFLNTKSKLWKTDTFYFDETIVNGSYNFFIPISTGKTINNEVYYPRIEVGNKVHSFVPQTGYEIVACGKNLLNNTAISTDVNGVSCTVNGDKSLYIKGTTDLDVHFILSDIIKNNLAGKEITMSCDEFDGVCLVLDYYNEDGEWQTSVSCAKEETILVQDYPKYRVYLNILSGTTLDKVFYPMLRFSEDTDTTYEPYVESRVAVNVDSELPLYGLKSFDKSTTILNDYNSEMTVQYALNETGASILSFSDRLTKLEAKVEALINA